MTLDHRGFIARLKGEAYIRLRNRPARIGKDRISRRSWKSRPKSRSTR